jgi:RNAse (barnase) inhibitor barstar
MPDKNFVPLISPHIYKSNLSCSEFKNYFETCKMKAIDKFVVLLDGEFMKDKNSLFKEFSMQLKFPGYFGYNWDSFEECINDLEWITANAFLIGINNSKKFLSSIRYEDMRVFKDILIKACDNWSQPYDEDKNDEDKKWGHPAKQFDIVLQYDLDTDLENFKKTIPNT